MYARLHDRMTKSQLKQARHQLGLTQAVMAKEMGIITRKLERWEAGHSPISDEGATLIKLLLEHERLAADAGRYRRLKKLASLGIGQNGVDWDLYFDGPAPDCLADLDGWLDGIGEVK